MALTPEEAAEAARLLRLSAQHAREAAEEIRRQRDERERAAAADRERESESDS